MPRAGEELDENVAELMVVRHGETTWNAGAIMQGQASSSLNDVGKYQSYAVANYLASKLAPIAAIYSSDLERAVDTANIIADKCNVSQVFLMEELRERHLGKLQGLPLKDARQLVPEAYKAFVSRRADEPIPGGGESLNEVHKRSKLALESIAEKHYGERVVVVTHGGVVRAMHLHATGVLASVKVVNASVNVIKITNEKAWTLHSWGDAAHLKGIVATVADPDSAD